jgi:thiamine-phosphate pyrophosphorylase
VIRYMITDGSAARNESIWLRNIARQIGAGLDFLQIREPELTARELVTLAKHVCARRGRVRVLINDRADVAIAAGADGVHLRDGSIAAARFRRIAAHPFLVSVACHNLEDAQTAAQGGADYILLAPVFEPISKAASRPPLGVERLRDAAAALAVPVIALGGITGRNARDCVEAGAAGIAGIALFSSLSA